MDEGRILDKLDSLDGKTTQVLVGLARVEEQIRDIPDLKTRVQALERWKWTAMGALGMAGSSVAAQVWTALRGG